MSAANTGTPAREKPSASTCNVTVLPVPVAPVTSPWRLANLSVRYSGFLLLPTKILSSLNTSAITSPVDCADSSNHPHLKNIRSAKPRVQAACSSRSFKRPHLDLRSGFYLYESLHITEGLRKDIARARQRRLVSLADRRTPEAERDSRPLGPIGNFAGRDHGACACFTLHFNRHIEIDLLAPGQRGRGDRQRRGNRLD